VNKTIEIGDRVNVYFDNVANEIHAEVLHIPVQQGDCWRLRRNDGGIVYVNGFSKMIKHMSFENINDYKYRVYNKELIK